MLPLLDADVTINGNGNTVSGNNQYRVFFAQQGTVSLNNLTIADGKAQGGNGGVGAGGGAGLGGGLFVNAAQVQLSGVQFTGNGGNGVSSNGGGGGMGGNGGTGTNGAGGGGFYTAGGNASGAGGRDGGSGGGGGAGRGGVRRPTRSPSTGVRSPAPAP
ncbi:hypothetical protein [uncultured Thiodictyon sp.]|jgi:hypothetical protein|uniref:hypothetical protein n=1 Tax=uncultured Thiodictyon sp. TaxID=1846217 RepID=UPI0025CC69FD|nr:hypothetical protein [uncultured Thiodictyon sp.]